MIDFEPDAVATPTINFEADDGSSSEGQLLTPTRKSRDQIKAEIDAKSVQQPGALGTRLLEMAGAMGSDASPVSWFGNAPRNLFNFPQNVAQVTGLDQSGAAPPVENNVPMVNIPKIEGTGMADFMRNVVGLPLDTQTAEIAQGAVNGLGGLVSGLSTPENAVTLPLAAGASVPARLLSAIFGSQMAHGFNESSQHAADTLYNPEATPADKAQALTEMGGGAALTTLAGAHAASPKQFSVETPSAHDIDLSRLSYNSDKPKFNRQDTLQQAETALRETGNVDLADRLGRQAAAVMSESAKVSRQGGEIPIIGGEPKVSGEIITPEQANARPGRIIVDEAPGRSQRDLQGGQVSFSSESKAKAIPSARQASVERPVGTEKLASATEPLITGPDAANYRRPQPAPTQAEYQKRLAKQSVEEGMHMPQGGDTPLSYAKEGQYPAEGGPTGVLSGLQSDRIVSGKENVRSNERNNPPMGPSEKPIYIPTESPVISDADKFETLKSAFKAATDPKEKMDIWKQLNDIQNRNGGMAPGKVRGTSVPPRAETLSRGSESSSSSSTLPPVDKKMTNEPRSILGRTEDWADAKIKDSKGNVSMNLDPELMVAYGIKGAAHIARGIKNFPEWSAAMIKEFGDIVKPHLPAIFERAKNEDTFKGKSFSTVTEKEAAKDKPFGLSIGKDRTLPVDSVRAKMRQLVGKDEMAALEEHGFNEFMQGKQRVNMDEMRNWLDENGPKVEVKKLTPEGEAEPLMREFADMHHSFYDELSMVEKSAIRDVNREVKEETMSFDTAWETYVTRKGLDRIDKEKARRYAELGVETMEMKRPVTDSATARFQMVNPKPLDKMPGAVDILVRKPNKRKSFGLMSVEEPTKFEGNHFQNSDKNILGWTRAYMETLPNGKKVFHVFEMQSDWAQKQREAHAAVKEGKFTNPTSLDIIKKADDPALSHYESLALKAAIEHARKEGADYIALSDGETAGLTEMHDKAIRIAREANGKEVSPSGHLMSLDSLITKRATPSSIMGELIGGGKYHLEKVTGRKVGGDYYKVVIDKEPYTEGNKQHYDLNGPNILEKLTGSKGERVDFGEHQNAVEHSHSPMEQQDPARYGQSRSTPRKDLIFKNTDGTPKTSITARMYPLEAVAKRLDEKRPMNIFSTQMGIAAPGSAELAKIIETLTPKERAVLTEPEMATATAGKIVKFRDYETEKKVATSPQGAGRVPGLAQILDPRSLAKDPESQAIIANAVMSGKGENFAALYLEGKKTAKRAFETDKEGKITLADGSKGFMSDVIEAEMRKPGSQKLTPEQKQFVADWKTIKDEFSAYASKEGVKRFVVGDSKAIDLEAPYFPRPAVGKHGIEEVKTGATKNGPGGAQFMQKGRYYETEAEGAGKIKYEGDEYNRIARYMASMYKAVADQRLANDPALKGRPLAGVAPKFLEEGMVFPPAFHGRVFPVETARKLNTYYGEAPHQWVRTLANINDFTKALKFTMDASAPFNQGLPLLGYNPLSWAKATAKSYQAFFDENVLSKYLAKGENQAIATRLVENGSSVGRLNDFLSGSAHGKLASKIPLAGKVIEASGRSMGTFLSIAKIELYKALEPTVEKSKLPELAEAVDNAILSGRMESIGMNSGRALGERLIFNAPSYMRAAINLVSMAAQGGISGKVARRSLIGMTTAIGMTMYGLYKSQGMSDDQIVQRFNPANGNFMRYPHKLSNGDVIEVGPGNILIQMARLIGTTAEIAMTDKKVGSGVEGNPWLRWLSYRKSPLVNTIMEVATAKDSLGRPVTAKQSIARSVVPIAAEQFIGDASKESKATEAGASFMGLSSMPESFSASRKRLMDEESTKRYGKAYTDLSINERKKVVVATAPALDKKKPVFGEQSAAYAMKLDNERKEKLVASMPPEVQSFLEKSKVKFRSYENALHKDGKLIPLDEAEQKAYAGIISEEYAKILRPLAARTNFANLKPEVQQRLVDERLELARNRAKTKMTKQLRPLASAAPQ